MKKIIFSALLLLGVLGVQAQTATTLESSKQSCSKSKSCNPEMCLGATVKDMDGKLVIVDVKEDSPAATAGLKSGDVITSANETNLTSVETLNEVMLMSMEDSDVQLSVQRGDEVMSTSVVMYSQNGMKKATKGKKSCASGKACCKSKKKS